MVSVVIMGPNGKMGRAMVRSACNNPQVRLVGGVAPEGRDYIGGDMGLLAGLGRSTGAKVVSNLDDIIIPCDVVLDCTTPTAAMHALGVCVEYGKAFVTGTTGFSAEERKKIEDAGRIIPVLPASNTSRLVHLLFELVRIAARKAGADADINIVEMHANTKRDAPSGTALEIGSILSAESGKHLEKNTDYAQNRNGVRSLETIHCDSIRSGGIPSTHQVIFGFENERLELTHHAYTMNAFADGMIAAALFIKGRKSGCYDISQVFTDR